MNISYSGAKAAFQITRSLRQKAVITIVPQLIQKTRRIPSSPAQTDQLWRDEDDNIGGECY
jgi:hypothetical protein